MTRNNTSGFTGVSFHRQRQKWIAQIQVDKKQHFLGLFKTRQLAADAYKAASEKYRGRAYGRAV